MAKWTLSALLGLGAAGFIVFAVLQAPRARAASHSTVEPVLLRPLSRLERAALAPVAAPPVVAKAPVATPAPAVPAPAPDAGVHSAPAVAARPEPAPRPAPAAAVGEGVLNLRASDTADVYLDGRKLGSSPISGVKARSGNHKVRFDCYDAAGNAVAGQVRVVTVTADEDQDVDYPCPESQ